MQVTTTRKGTSGVISITGEVPSFLHELLCGEPFLEVVLLTKVVP